jgi:hypothetical protein
MIETSFKKEVCICPNKSCGNQIDISIGSFPGGINDYGGWILECNKCSHIFAYEVKNPDDASSITNGGAKKLDSWDRDVPNDKEELFAKYKIENFTNNMQYDTIRVIETGEKERHVFSDIEANIFYCPKCNTHLEPILYGRLASRLNDINAAIGAYMNFYLKGRNGDPKSIIILTEYLCACDHKSKVVLYKEFIERELPAEDIHEFMLIDVIGNALERDIDGVFDRDDCKSILQKLLIRWKVYYNKVLLAVPFIGFDFKFRKQEEQRVELWNWILKNTDPSKTTLVTRKATFKSFLEGSAKTGFPIDTLKRYGLLNPTIDELTEKKALFKTDFHAKFFAGVGTQSTEVLTGSFNIHEGIYVENIHFKSYSTVNFMTKYLLPMKMGFNPGTHDECGEFLLVKENAENKYGATLEKYSTCLADRIAEIISQ